MLLWFVGPSILIVWAVFRSPSADYRMVAAGSLLPLLEVPVGEPRLLNSLAGSASAMAVVMFAARGRLEQRRWLGIPIGMLLHLVLTGAWADARGFWWPVLGVSWSTAELPVLGRGMANVVLEVAGAAACWWGWRQFRLDEPQRRARFARTGQVGRDLAR